MTNERTLDRWAASVRKKVRPSAGKHVFSRPFWEAEKSLEKKCFFYIFIKKLCFQIEGAQWTLCASQMNIKTSYFPSWVEQAQLFNPLISQIFDFFAQCNVFASGLLGELYSELFNEGISKHKMWAKMFPENMLWKGNESQNCKRVRIDRMDWMYKQI